MGDTWLYLEFLFTLSRNSIYTADKVAHQYTLFLKEMLV